MRGFYNGILVAVSGILVPLGEILSFSVRDLFIPSFANGISPRLI